jgi:hypothetical protein
MKRKRFSRICTVIGLFFGLIVAWESALNKEMSMSDISMGGTTEIRCDDCDSTIDAGKCSGSSACEKIKLTTCKGSGGPYTMDCHLDWNYCEEQSSNCDEGVGTAECKD